MSVFGKAGSTKGKILIIDDEEDVREVIKLHLDSDKYDLIEASNGEDAIKVDQTPLVIPDLGFSFHKS